MKRKKKEEEKKELQLINKLGDKTKLITTKEIGEGEQRVNAKNRKHIV